MDAYQLLYRFFGDDAISMDVIMPARQAHAMMGHPKITPHNISGALQRAARLWPDADPLELACYAIICMAARRANMSPRLLLRQLTHGEGVRYC